MRRPMLTGRAFRLSSAATMLAGLPLKLSSIRVQRRADRLLDAAPGHDADLAELRAPAPPHRDRAGMDADASAASAFCADAARRASGSKAICLPTTCADDVPALAMRARDSAARTSDAPPKRSELLPLPFRRIRRRRGSTSTPSCGRPCEISTFSRRIASRLPSFSRCTGCTLTTSATVGRVNSLSRAISPAWFMPISKTQSAGVGLALHSVSGTPQKLLKTARAGIGACG